MPWQPRGGMPTLILVFALASWEARAQGPSPLVPEAVAKLSPHTYLIASDPNIGIVVGTRATLVIETGLGRRNGETVARQAAKFAKAPQLYLTSTHYHPEHAMGADGFPPDTIVVRPRVQEAELETRGDVFLDVMRGLSALHAELMRDLRHRPANVLFDDETTLDLGGVHARLIVAGPAHTRGDQVIFIPEDGVLFAGAVVANRQAPNTIDDSGSVTNWVPALDRLERLKPRLVVPDHTAPGDASLISAQRAFLVDLQQRTDRLRAQHVPPDDAGRTILAELKTRYPGWAGLEPFVAITVKRLYEQAR